MWTIYILTGASIAFIVLNIVVFIFDKSFRDEVVISEIISGGIGLAAIMLLASIIIALFIPSKTFMAKYEYDIIALQDNQGVDGSFFLGIGSVNSSMKYFMYVDYGDHVKMKTLSTERTEIKVSDKPYLEIKQRTEVPNAFINNFSLLFNDYEKFTIYVPEGTIKQNYTLDAK